MTEWRQEDYQNTHNHNKTDDRSCFLSDLRFTLKEKGKEKKTTYADDCTEFTHGHLLCSVYCRRHLVLVLMTMMRCQESANELEKSEER